MSTHASLTNQQKDWIAPTKAMPGDLITAQVDWSRFSSANLLALFYSVNCNGPHFHVVNDNNQKAIGTFATIGPAHSYCRYVKSHGYPCSVGYAVKVCRFCKPLYQ